MSLLQSADAFAKHWYQTIIEAAEEELPDQATAEDFQSLLFPLRRLLNDVEYRPPPFSFWGTVNSGKSTLINGLLGDLLLPTGLYQTNKGVVQLTHRTGLPKVYRLSSEIFTHSSDTSILNRVDMLYSTLKKVFDLHSQEENISENIADPYVHIGISLNRLSQRVGMQPEFLQIFDLPGLDLIPNTPLPLEQRTALEQSIPIIVFNYNEIYTTEKHQYMLNWLRTNCRTVSRENPPIFLLNRVDEYNNTNDPISAQVEALQKNITDMGFNNSTVIPCSGLLLLYAEKISMLFSSLPDWDSDAQAQIEEELCSLFYILKKFGINLRPYREIRNKLEEQISLDLHELIDLQRFVFEVSGAKGIYKELSLKQEGFKEKKALAFQ